MPTLSEATSKVTLSDALFSNRPLSKKRKYQLKTEIVKKLIKSKPYGKRLTVSELASALHTSHGNAWGFVGRLMRDGVIVKHNLSQRTFFFTVSEPLVISKPADPEKVEQLTGDKPAEPPHVEDKPVDKLEPPAPDLHEDAALLDTAAAHDFVRKIELRRLESQAMRFKFYHPEGTLPEFIEWLAKDSQ